MTSFRSSTRSATNANGAGAPAVGHQPQETSDGQVPDERSSSSMMFGLRGPSEPRGRLGLDERLEFAEPREVLIATAASFAHGRVAVVSAFGPGTMVLLDLLAELRIRLPVVFIDTLHHFAETLEHVEQARDRYDLDLRIYRPAADRAEFESRYGLRLWERNLELYQQLTKVEPFQRAIRGVDAYVTGRRRDQSPTRAELRVVEGRAGSETGRPLRINPLARWTQADVWTYVERRGVPVNPLHYRGYASIGDEPLTTPIAPGEHERAGRWRGTNVLECGIHTLGGC